MSFDGAPEGTRVARIEADLAELTTHVDTWLQDRFLSSETPVEFNIEDAAGLVAWLNQWQTHFDGYDASANPATAARLAQIRTEIDNSIARVTEMAAALPVPPQDPHA